MNSKDSTGGRSDRTSVGTLGGGLSSFIGNSISGSLSQSSVGAKSDMSEQSRLLDESERKSGNDVCRTDWELLESSGEQWAVFSLNPQTPYVLLRATRHWYREFHGFDVRQDCSEINKDYGLLDVCALHSVHTDDQKRGLPSEIEQFVTAMVKGHAHMVATLKCADRDAKKQSNSISEQVVSPMVGPNVTNGSVELSGGPVEFVVRAPGPFSIHGYPINGWGDAQMAGDSHGMVALLFSSIKRKLPIVEIE